MMTGLLSAALLLVGASSIRLHTGAPDYGHPDWLGDCDSIYLDIGTNIGVQIRKLFEPHKYPGASVLPIFNNSFGEAKHRPTTVCALGMEPNPHHMERLRMLEEAYNKRGFRTHIYPFAAWKEEGTIEFRTDMEDFTPDTDNWNSQNEETGGHLARELKEVRSVDLSAFIKSLPQGKVKLMKIDIEGSEYEALARAIPEHIMCKSVIPQVYMEAHWWGNTETWQDQYGMEAISNRILQHDCPQSSPAEMLEVDDETYLHDIDDDFSL